MQNSCFILEMEGSFIVSLQHPEDTHRMNWVKKGAQWGATRHPKGLAITVERSFTENGCMQEVYAIANQSDFPLITGMGDIAIQLPLNDTYASAEVCMSQCCHAHIWCGGSSSYVMGLRMGGSAPHLGLVVTRGAVNHYSVEREPSELSNDRGIFWMHPGPLKLNPGETYILAWEIFWHNGAEDFYTKASTYGQYLHVDAPHYVLFQGEEFTAQVQTARPEKLAFPAQKLGENIVQLTSANGDTWVRYIVLPPLWDLAQARCKYITGKQQMCASGSPLDGAYLVYDREENHLYYSHAHDHNAGRERVGMGVLLAVYLQNNRLPAIEKSLESYVEFVLRELYDDDTGRVYNDINHAMDYERPYNYPWVANLFMELYTLWNKPVWLIRMVKVMEAFYRDGGMGFYAIGIPMYESIEILRQAGMHTQAGRLLELYTAHADAILANGTNYPAHEVNYEQSIVAPAATYLLSVFRLTAKEKYLKAAEQQLAVLALFNGHQPDGYLHQVAIRHWDGYWFGKSRLLGDTFPHYWTMLTGLAYHEYYLATGNEDYRLMAEQSFRGALTLLFPDGSASCARLHPFAVNGQAGQFFDPWCNDQDWGLYYAIKYLPKEGLKAAAGR